MLFSVCISRLFSVWNLETKPFLDPDPSLKTDSFDIFNPCLSVYDQNLSLLGFLTQVRFQ